MGVKKREGGQNICSTVGVQTADKGLSLSRDCFCLSTLSKLSNNRDWNYK